MAVAAQFGMGIAGAVVGSFFGPLGAQLGWAAGSMVGGMLFGKSAKGPKLNDTRVSGASYGTPITMAWGTIRTAPQVIWKTKLKAHKKKSSGKGSPKPTAVEYTCSFALKISQTSFIDGDGNLVNEPIVDILRIWANGRLIYGPGSDATALPMVIYYGTEDELADPTMEAELGTGKSVPFRGYSGIVFTAMPMGGFGNAMPNWEIEYVASGSIDLKYYAIWPVDYDYPSDSAVYSYPYSLNGVESTADGIVLHRYRSGDNYGAIPGNPANNPDNSVVYYDRRVYDIKGNPIGSPDAQIQYASPFDAAFVFGSLNSGIAYVTGQYTYDCRPWGAGQYTYFNTYRWMKDGAVTFEHLPEYMCPLATEDFAHTWLVQDQQPIQTSPVYWNGYVYAGGFYVGGDVKIRRWLAPDGAVRVHNPETGYEFNADAVRTGYPTSNCNADPGDIFIADDGYLYWLVGYFAGVTDGIRLFKLDADLNVIKTWWTGSGATLPTPGYGSCAIYRGHIIGGYSTGIHDAFNPNYRMYKLNNDGTTTWVDEVRVDSLPSPVISIGNGYAAVRDGILNLGSGQVTLAEIVASVSARAKFKAVQYDVTQLASTLVRGFTALRAPARSIIEPLQQVFQFGAAEVDLKATFVKWGGSSVATIPFTDLGFTKGNAPIAPLEITHVQDFDLPRQVSVAYRNVEMDYQDGEAHQQRPDLYTTDIKADLSATSIVLNPTEAQSVADITLYNAWIERERFKFNVSVKWAHLVPTDIVTINQYTIRLTQKREVGMGEIEFEGVATRSDVFLLAPVAPVPVGFTPQTPPGSINTTDFGLMDLPLISDSDFSLGIYARLAGRTAASWPGCTLYKSVDGGANYADDYSTIDETVWGAATTVLGDFTGGNIFDTMNSLTVRLAPGSDPLVSSNELGVLNGANMAVVISSDGSVAEVLQYTIATLIDTDTYTLSGFLRGRRGTDWAIPLHGFDEVFVALPCHNVQALGAELGMELLYKAVTTGGTLSRVTALAFTNNGVATKCYAPVSLGGGRNGAGDVTLTGVRRTRIGGSWLDNVDVPLSEGSEQYVWTIYADSTFTPTGVKWYDFSSTPSYTYTAARQTTDFGSLQSTIYFTMQQVGAYGPGYAARGSA